MGPASEELLDRYAAVLADLGADHGLGHFRHGRLGTLVADVAPSRTYLDVAGFEREAQGLLNGSLSVAPSGAPSARDRARRPLVATSAA